MSSIIKQYKGFKNVKLYEACFEVSYQHSKHYLKSNLIDLYHFEISKSNILSFYN